MDELRGLLLDGADDLGVAMAGGVDGDAGGEVEELVAVDVFDAAAEAAFDGERITAGVAGRKQGFVAGNDLPGVGAGQGADDLRAEAGVGLRGGSAWELQDHGAHWELFFPVSVRWCWDRARRTAEPRCGDATVFAKDGEAAGVNRAESGG